MLLSTVPALKMIEDPRVRDIYASDLGRIEITGPNVRFIFYVEQFREEGSPAEFRTVNRIVLPRAIVHSAIQRTFFALGEPTPPILQTTHRLC